jgi:hypothetical protein
MKLTPQQRLLVYEALLKVVCKDSSVVNGMCFYLDFLLDESKKVPYIWKRMRGCDKMELLDELKRKAPRPQPVYWAPRTKKGWETRIHWIEQSIIEVKKKIK